MPKMHIRYLTKIPPNIRGGLFTKQRPKVRVVYGNCHQYRSEGWTAPNGALRVLKQEALKRIKLFFPMFFFPCYILMGSLLKRLNPSHHLQKSNNPKKYFTKKIKKYKPPVIGGPSWYQMCQVSALRSQKSRALHYIDIMVKWSSFVWCSLREREREMGTASQISSPLLGVVFPRLVPSNRNGTSCSEFLTSLFVLPNSFLW